MARNGIELMKTTIISTVFLLSVTLVGCSKKSSPPGSRLSAGPPVAHAVLAAWQQGDRSGAISNFVQTDWRNRPLFASSYVLSLTEDQYKALSNSEREARSREITSQISSLKQLAQAVMQAGRDAAAKGDTAQARKYFTSLQDFGAAVGGSDSMLIVQLVGKAIRKMGDTELAKVQQ